MDIEEQDDEQDDEPEDLEAPEDEDGEEMAETEIEEDDPEVEPEDWFANCEYSCLMFWLKLLLVDSCIYTQVHFPSFNSVVPSRKLLLLILPSSMPKAGKYLANHQIKFFNIYM